MAIFSSYSHSCLYFFMCVICGLCEEKVVNFQLAGATYALRVHDDHQLNATEIGEAMIDFIKKIDGMGSSELDPVYERQVQQDAQVISRFLLESESHTIKAMSDYNITVESKYNNLTFMAPCGVGTYVDLADPMTVQWWGMAKYSDEIPGFKLGRFTSIGQHVNLILDGNHCYSSVSSFPWGTQPLYSPAVVGKKISIYRMYQPHDYTQAPPCTTATKLRPITVGNDVWIGAHVTIMMGVTIGDGAVIGAHSVVRSDVEPYTIVVGNPAQFLKYRFDPALVPAMLDIKWWNWSVDTIVENIHLFTNYESNNIELFITRAAELAAAEEIKMSSQ
jgi:acetyltransferase-like isoleucine patch superfamily enzyme